MSGQTTGDWGRGLTTEDWPQGTDARDIIFQKKKDLFVVLRLDAHPLFNSFGFCSRSKYDSGEKILIINLSRF